jgi:hypothetical protein
MKFIKLSSVLTAISAVAVSASVTPGNQGAGIQKDSEQVQGDRNTKKTARTLDAKAGKVPKEPTPSPTNKVKLGGAVHPRLDMEEFLKPNNKEQQDLLILAWQALYNRPWHDPLGFYQIATIHANPVLPYDDSINEDLGVSVSCYFSCILICCNLTLSFVSIPS